MTVGRNILIALLLIFIISWLKFLYFPVITHTEGYLYRVPAGSSIRVIAEDLHARNIISNLIYFKCLVKLKGNGQALKAGEYFFPKGSTPLTILNQLTTGEGIIYQVFTIIPGWGFKELVNALLQEPHLIHTLENLSPKQLMQILGKPGLLPEGWFYPDTYYYLQGDSDVSLLKRAFKAMEEKLTRMWQNREVGLPYKTPYQALIAASLIEKEAYLKTEKPLIAGVLVNRLRKGMLLQFDPTVIYGKSTLFLKKITKENLTENTPYNTYLHVGLPPSPIALPSLESLMAALHPADHTFLYFVAKGDGSHQFSVSFEEHRQAILKLKNIPHNFFNQDLLAHAFLNFFSCMNASCPASPFLRTPFSR